MATKISYRLRPTRFFNFLSAGNGKIYDDLEMAMSAREDRRRYLLGFYKPNTDGFYRIRDSSYRDMVITHEQLLTYIDRQSNVETLPVSIPDADGVDAETAILIADSIFGYLGDELADSSCSTQWSDAIVTRGKQRFAVFGGMAYELLRFDTAGEDGTEFEYRPVFCGGKMFRMDPDEGSGGMLYLMRRTMKNNIPENGEWTTSLLQGGWLNTEELDMTNDQIMENIVDEIDRGENVLTRKPAGWA
jgi:hypothetical protein